MNLKLLLYHDTGKTPRPGGLYPSHFTLPARWLRQFVPAALLGSLNLATLCYT
ncbi:TPA: hypothetical protein ACYRSE_002782 [Klebsiella michiganensis]|uniref:hypothetical protein n=1 Tax=Klebsiella TaxID=570 RepID=UPI00026BB0D4|nr:MULTISPECIES: hypothetical protein [Klebsiella]AFN30232.1 hypothetical protein A225_0321 [Klebsiella michiganensis E718]MBD0982945.1 hypothetical protein [Klebsiella michiganensis]MBG2660639.1 hypothetical protein [Klebsiella michiganensis]MDD9640658.1 hypothetical protein [Klebsiella michiganensis]MDH1973666.1 hypothetical protein [Klebsiella michiganensis]